MIPLIETVRGLAAVNDVLSVPGVWTAAFGSLDFALDLGCQPSFSALLSARSELLFRSRLAGLPPPLDGVTTELDAPEIVAQDAAYASELGFGGKLAIHPKQIAAIRLAFRPDEATANWARNVLVLADSGAAQLNGQMIDRPVIDRARQILRMLSVERT